MLKRDWSDLKSLYEESKLSSYEIAKLKKCSVVPVFLNLRKQGISIRKGGVIKGKRIGFKHSEETKRKIKESNIKTSKNRDVKGKNNPFHNKKHNEETKSKIRCSKYHKNLKGENNPNYGNHKLKGHKLTKEQCEKIRVSKLGNTHTLGLKHTKETIQKMKSVLRRHHIYLKENSDKIILLSVNKHIQIHLKAYNYLYDKYGKRGIDDYIKWFDRNYGLKDKK